MIKVSYRINNAKVQIQAELHIDIRMCDLHIGSCQIKYVSGDLEFKTLLVEVGTEKNKNF